MYAESGNPKVIGQLHRSIPQNKGTRNRRIHGCMRSGKGRPERDECNSQLGVSDNDAALTGVGSGGAVHRQTELLNAGGILLAYDFDGLLGGDVFIFLACRGLCGWGVLLLGCQFLSPC